MWSTPPTPPPRPPALARRVTRARDGRWETWISPAGKGPEDAAEGAVPFPLPPRGTEAAAGRLLGECHRANRPRPRARASSQPQFPRQETMSVGYHCLECTCWLIHFLES